MNNNNLGNQIPNNQNNNLMQGSNQNPNLNQVNYGQLNQNTQGQVQYQNQTNLQSNVNNTNQTWFTPQTQYQQQINSVNNVQNNSFQQSNNFAQPVQNINYAQQQSYTQQPNNFYQPGVNNGQNYVQPGTNNYQNIPPNNGYNGNFQYAGAKVNNNSGKKNALIIFVTLIVAVLVVGWFAKKTYGEGGVGRKTDYDRTIMIYMVGANLESESGLGTADLNGLDFNALESQNTKVILIAGGAKNWYNNYVSNNETSIYELKSTGFVKVKQQQLLNMGESQVLTDFLKYGYDNYKSKKYDLIFWNHGGGILGSEFDELHDSDQLSLQEMQSAFKNSPFSSKNKLEVVIFRTCLNGTIEMADTLKDYSKYLVASEEITRGHAYSGSVFKSFNDIKSSDDGKEVGKKFVDGYVNYIQSIENLSGTKIYTTYSVIDLSKISKLESSLEDFFSSIDINSNYALVARVRSNLYQYGESESGYDSIDLYSLVDGIKTLSPSKAQTLMKNIQSAVVYSYSSDNNSHGLSVYFPYKADAKVKQYILSGYYNFASLTKYKDFITGFNGIQTSSKFSTSFANNNIELARNNEDSDFSIQLTEEQKNNFSRAGFIVFRDNKDGYYLPVYSSGGSGKSVKLDGDTLKAGIKDRQLKVKSTKDNTESIITLIEDSETDEYIKYKTYVILQDYTSKNPEEWKSDTAEATIVLDKKTNKITLGTLLLRNKQDVKEGKTNLPYTVIVDPKEYHSIAFASSSYKVVDSQGNYVNDWESNGVMKGVELTFDELSFELNDFNDGYDYYAVFKIWDINNNSYYSKLVKMK